MSRFTNSRYSNQSYDRSIAVLYKPAGVKMSQSVLDQFYMSAPGVELCCLEKNGKLKRIGRTTRDIKTEDGVLMFMSENTMTYPIIRLTGDRFAIILKCKMVDSYEPARFIALGDILSKEDGLIWKNTLLKSGTAYVSRSGDDFNVESLPYTCAGCHSNLRLVDEDIEEFVEEVNEEIFTLEPKENFEISDIKQSVSFKKVPKTVKGASKLDCYNKVNAMIATCSSKDGRLCIGDIVVNATFVDNVKSTTIYYPHVDLLNTLLNQWGQLQLEVRRYQADVETWLNIKATVYDVASQENSSVKILSQAAKAYYSDPQYVGQTTISRIKSIQIYVANVGKGSILDELGCQTGDLIYSIHSINNGEIICPSIEQFEENNIIGLEILRDQCGRIIYLTLGSTSDELILPISYRAKVIDKIMQAMKFANVEDADFHREQLEMLADEDLLTQPGAK